MDSETLTIADFLLKTIPEGGASSRNLQLLLFSNGINPIRLNSAVQYLCSEGFLDKSNSSHNFFLRLTVKAIELKHNNRTFSTYWKEKQETKPLEQQMKELQIDFWKSGIARDRRQRWQFWLTFWIALAAFVLSVINFVKSIILP